jgi:hypothetical protein
LRGHPLSSPCSVLQLISVAWFPVTPSAHLPPHHNGWVVPPVASLWKSRKEVGHGSRSQIRPMTRFFFRPLSLRSCDHHEVTWYVLICPGLGRLGSHPIGCTKKWPNLAKYESKFWWSKCFHFQSISINYFGDKRIQKGYTCCSNFLSSEHFGTSIVDRTIAVSSWESPNPSQSFQYVGTLRKSNEMGNPLYFGSWMVKSCINA